MSGPPYPHPNPAPGSNAIGSFVIGVSPVGSISPFDWWTTVISQYANSPIITALLQNFNDSMDMTANYDDLFDMFVNIDSASGVGLDSIGRIVGVARILNIINAGKYFGFEEATTISADPFGQSPFYVGAAVTTNFALSDSAYRVLIFAKMLANISDGSIKSINALLLALFPERGNAYVVDLGGMAMQYVFDFALTAVEAAIVTQSGVLPNPTGVTVTFIQNG